MSIQSLQMSSSNNMAEQAKKLLSLKEVAEYMKVHEVTVRRWVKENRIKSLRVGKLIRFREQDVEDWMER